MVTIRKNARECICLRLETYQGHRFLDVRIWTTGEDGEQVPTRKGVAVPLSAMPEFVEAVVSIGKEGAAGA
jgi:hypothetical protein